MKQLSSKPKFKVGDKVRISKKKRKVFYKGTHLIGLKRSSWSIRFNPQTQGSFYEPELLKAKQDVFRIDSHSERLQEKTSFCEVVGI